MNATRRQLKAQFDRAVKLGWLPHFEAAELLTRGYFDVADLLAIASRETNLDPKWLKKPGDGGHGFGLMQIDIRSFPEFTASPDWKDARKGILYGAKVLMQKWHDYEQNIGKLVKVKNLTFTAAAASGQLAQHIVISSYNCGRWAQYAHAKGQPIDKYSTGHDYGQDVMERARVFRSFLSNSSAAADGDGQGNAGLVPTPDGNQTPAAIGDAATVDQPPTSANIAVEKEVQVGFFQKIKLKVTGWIGYFGGVEAAERYKGDIDSLGLPTGWIKYFLLVGIFLFLFWVIYEAAAHLVEMYQKKHRTDALLKANANAPGKVLLACPEDLDAFERAGWTVIRRANVVPPVEGSAGS